MDELTIADFEYDSVAVRQDYAVCPFAADSVQEDAPSLTLEEKITQFFPVDERIVKYAKEDVAHEGVGNDFMSLVPAKEGVPLKNMIQAQVWFAPLVLMMVIVYAKVLSSSSKMMLQEAKEFFYPKSRNDLFTSSVAEVSRMRLVVNVISVLSASLFCYFALYEMFGMSPLSVTGSFARIVGIMVVYILLKVLAIALVCYTFFDSSVMGVLKRSYTTLTSCLAASLFVVAVVAAYAPHTIAVSALWVGVILCFIGVLLYVYKILSIFFNGMTSLFYLILYLCTLEILPSVALLVGLLNFV